MSKNLEIIICIAVLLIAVSVFYYLVIFLPELQRTTAEKQVQADKAAVQNALIKICENKYDTLTKTTVAREGMRCLPDTYGTDSIFYCSEFHTIRKPKDAYVDNCVNLLNP